MSKEILTNKVFLDTSIFVKENFFVGSKLRAFFKHQEEENIILLTSSIIRNECHSNLDKGLAESNSTLNKLMNDLNQKAKVFKNIDALNSIFDLRHTFDFDNEKKKLKDKLDKNFDDFFEEVDVDKNKLSKILDDYFAENPPFKMGGKKSEFPDAIILNSLETWCEVNGIKVYVVSDDPDWNSFSSDYLIPIKEYDKLLDQISFTYSAENINDKIKNLIYESKGEIIIAVKDAFVNSLPTSGFDAYRWIEYEVESIDQIEIEIIDHSLLSSYDNTAEVEILLNVKFRAKVSCEDDDTGWFDKETGEYYGREYIKREITNECHITSNFEIEIELPGKEVLSGEFELVEITNGIPKNLSFETEYA